MLTASGSDCLKSARSGRSVGVFPDDVVHHGKRNHADQRNESTSEREQPDHCRLQHIYRLHQANTRDGPAIDASQAGTRTRQRFQLSHLRDPLMTWINGITAISDAIELVNMYLSVEER